MYQASQKAVVQEANMILINIRTAEVAYFSTFFSNFGTQVAIVTGCICGALSQTPGLPGQFECPYFFVFMYFACSAAALVISLQCLLSTLVASVYGQGLALRGPLGSMVVTIDGMITEQRQIVFTFVLAIACFVGQAAAMFAVVMDDTMGPICFTISMVGACVTYYYALRIYNRFFFEKDTITWQEEDPAEKLFEELNPDNDEHIRSNKEDRDVGNVVPFQHNKNNVNHHQRQQNDSHHNSGHHKMAKKRRSVLSAINPFQKKKGADDSEVVHHAGKYTEAFNEFQDQSDAPYVQMNDLDSSSNKTMPDLAKPRGANKQEGYLAVKTAKVISMDPWERRYFVLTGKNIFYYKDKRSFQLQPDQPINSRPIDLEGYILVAGAVEPPYAISLIPANPAEDIRKSWKFRCDTLAEFHQWIDKFSVALKLCEGGGDSTHSLNDLVVLGVGKRHV